MSRYRSLGYPKHFKAVAEEQRAKRGTVISLPCIFGTSIRDHLTISELYGQLCFSAHDPYRKLTRYCRAYHPPDALNSILQNTVGRLTDFAE